MDSQFPTGTVTFLFTDIEGSTPLWEQMPQAMQLAVAQHHEILNQAIENHNGKVFQILGDAFQAAFPLATDGLRAALAAQQALQSANWGLTGPLRVRMGLHIGPAEIEQREGPWGGQYAVSHTLNRSARVMSAGHGGQILLSQEAALLVKNGLPEGVYLKDLGLNRLKGMVQLEQIYQVIAPDLQRDFPPLASSITRPHNLPARITSFIGRGPEIDTVCSWLSLPEIRLLTITGVGGTGKTSLAIQVGLRLLDSFRDGVFFVDLTSVREYRLVISAIAGEISVHELPGRTIAEVLTDHLSKRQLLLILDNFEQVLGAGLEIVQLLASAPHLKVLVTSREPLLVMPEQIYTLSPLPLPSTRNGLVDVQNNDSVRLFIERASATKPGFVLSAENAPAIVDICNKLDGLPLAIELIAARVRLLSPIQLRDQLTTRLRLLSASWRDLPSRHQTMRAAIAWSYDLLSEDEKILFRRLAVFPGSFNLEAIEAICGGEGLNLLLSIESLLNKNLVNLREHGSQTRFWMFQTIHEYALELLEASGEEGEIRRKHAEYYTQLAITHPGQSYSLWELEMDNLRTAMHWAVASRAVDIGLKISGNFFIWEKNVSEGRLLINQILNLPGAQAPTLERAKALYSAAALSLFQRDVIHYQILEQELAEVSRIIDSPSLILLSKFASAHRLVLQEDYRGGIDLLMLCLEENTADRFSSATYFNSLASLALLLNDLARAKDFIREAQTIFEELGEWTLPYVIDGLSLQGFIAFEENNLSEAESFFKQAFSLAIQLDIHHRLGIIYSGLSRLAVLSKDKFTAVYWMSMAETIAKITGYSSRVLIDRILEHYQSVLKSSMKPSEFQQAWDDAQKLSLEQVIEFGKEHLFSPQATTLLN